MCDFCNFNDDEIPNAQGDQGFFGDAGTAAALEELQRLHESGLIAYMV